MTRLTALLLAVAVPAAAQQQQQQVSLVPVKTESPAWARKERPLHERPETWIIAGAATIAVAATIAGLVVLGLQLSGADRTSPGGSPAPVRMSDFACGASCDGWVDEPPK